MTPADQTFDAQSFFDAIQALGATPVTQDLEGVVALSVLRRQFTELVSAHAQSGYSLVYRPGEPSPSGNVFASWTALMAAYGQFDGPMIIFFDDSLVTPAFIPAGTYVFREGTIFSGLLNRVAMSPDAVVVEFEEGVQLVGIVQFQYVLRMQVHGVTAPLFPPAAAGTATFVVLDKGATFEVIEAGGRVFDVPANTILFVAMFNAELTTGVSEVVRGLDPTSTIGIAFFLQGDLQQDTIAGDGTLVHIIESTAALISLTQTGFIGTTVQQFNTSAFLEGYSPTVLADWSGIDPVNVGTALDRIAAVLSPIP